LTVEELKNNGLGKIVMNLRKHSNEKIKERAVEVVTIWKNFWVKRHLSLAIVLYDSHPFIRTNKNPKILQHYQPQQQPIIIQQHPQQQSPTRL